MRTLLRHAAAAAAVLLALVCLIGFLRSRRDMDEVRDLIIAGVCLIAFFFSDEFSEFTGSYGWTRRQWRHYPAQAVRWIAGIALAVLTCRMWQK
jgi:hypothetical protein